MQVTKLPLSDTHAFNSFFLDYIDRKEVLKPFYNHFPAIENFKAQIDAKRSSFSDETRKTLSQTLERQYSSIKSITQGPVNDNIALLKKSTTFTVTTGHQLNIFTGPLYFIYKIVTVINACRQLKKQYPEFDFVPVYWMASEDHDYDEIKYFKLYGKKYVWETDQKGAVGRFIPNGLAKIAGEIPGDLAIFKDAYSKSKTLSDAVRHYVHALFADEGLVVLDADDSALKEKLKAVIEDDIFRGVNKACVDKTNAQLESLGYKTQVYCREINFFYLHNDIRERIEKEKDKYRVINTELLFSEDELRELVKNHPERFSPNVILRPLYQEMILPNLAYVGGPAEIVYWLQLKSVFDNCHVPFPMLMPRNFAMVMDHEVSRKFDKTGLELKEIFEDKNFLFNHWVLKYSPRDLTVGHEREGVHSLFQQLRERAESVDKSLSQFVGAEGKRALNSLEKIERKFLRAEKRLHSDKLRQIEFVKDHLFPNGNLQERTDNFLNFYLEDRSFIPKLLSSFDPFDFSLHVLKFD